MENFMNKAIDLPKNIKPNTKILVKQETENEWRVGYFVGQVNDVVFAKIDKDGILAVGWDMAKMIRIEIDWTEVPIGTEVRFRDIDDETYHTGVLAAVVKGIPYISDYSLHFFDINDGCDNPKLYPHDYVELIKED